MGCSSLPVRNTQAHQGQYPRAWALLQRGSATNTYTLGCQWRKVDTLTPIESHMSTATCIIYCWSQTLSCMSRRLDVSFNLNHLDVLLPYIKNAPGWVDTKHSVIPCYWVQVALFHEQKMKVSTPWYGIVFPLSACHQGNGTAWPALWHYGQIVSRVSPYLSTWVKVRL